MQIDDLGTSQASGSASRKPRSSRSSVSHADRGSVPIAGTDLSHSEIMQKLQNKVKSRLAAKEKAANADSNGGRNGSSKNGVNTSKAAKAAKASSAKRSASASANQKGLPVHQQPRHRSVDAAVRTAALLLQLKSRSHRAKVAARLQRPKSGVPLLLLLPPRQASQSQHPILLRSPLRQSRERATTTLQPRSRPPCCRPPTHLRLRKLLPIMHSVCLSRLDRPRVWLRSRQLRARLCQVSSLVQAR